jgi:type 1 fimbria pilin
MKKFILALLGSASLIALLFSVGLAADKSQTFTGEIMDQQCALLGGHSAMMNQGESAKDCANRCVSIGGKYVLFDSANKTIYQLDDQKKAQPFAGAKVKITGTYDTSSKTIHVANIQSGS